MKHIKHYDLQDDEIDEMASFGYVAKLLKDRGAYKIYVMATHGTFSEDCLLTLERSAIDEVCPLLEQEFVYILNSFLSIDECSVNYVVFTGGCDKYSPSR